MKKDEMISATSKGPGNPVFIVGSHTGKDGIHGASFASKDITEDSAEDLPAVQVGDPFQEKLLLEATLELAKTDAVVGMQDMVLLESHVLLTKCQLRVSMEWSYGLIKCQQDKKT